MSSPPSSNAEENPPHFILVSQSPLPSGSTASRPSYKSFTHPVIEYHYADDLPHALLPQNPQEHVLVLDYDPTNATPPVAQSLSTDLAVLGVKATEAPASGPATDDSPNPKKNGQIYVIETTQIPSETLDEYDVDSGQAVISEFKQRNKILRAALEYPVPLRRDCHDILMANTSQASNELLGSILG